MLVQHREFGAIAAAYFAHFGLSIPEWRVMAVLAANPGLSAAEVTARTAMDKVAVSRAVATLLAAGPPAAHHGHGGPPPHPPRAHARRHACLRAGRAHGAQYERHLVAPLSKRDRATLDRILRVLLGRAVELGPAHAD